MCLVYVFGPSRVFCVQDADLKAIQQGTNMKFKGIPRDGSLLNRSVIDTLHYCCLYHYDLGEVTSHTHTHTHTNTHTHSTTAVSTTMTWGR